MIYTESDPKTWTMFEVRVTMSSLPMRIFQKVFAKAWKLLGLRFGSLNTCMSGSLASSDMEQDLGLEYFGRVIDRCLKLELKIVWFTPRIPLYIRV